MVNVITITVINHQVNVINFSKISKVRLLLVEQNDVLSELNKIETLDLSLTVNCAKKETFKQFVLFKLTNFFLALFLSFFPSLFLFISIFKTLSLCFCVFLSAFLYVSMFYWGRQYFQNHFCLSVCLIIGCFFLPNICNGSF